MGLFGRNATTVGLDIGSGLIKLVAISHASGGPVLTKVAFTSVVNDAIVEGEVMDPGIVAEAIKDLLASAGIKAKKVVTAVGGRDVIIKKITMDRMKEAEAREVIRWEAEQHVPFDMDNVELDFQILDPEGEGLQMTVLLVAAKRELVEHKVALLSDVGLDASVIDVDAFALHNAFEINYPEAMHGVVGLVNIGHETTNINILDDGVPVLTRDIPIGTRRFKEDLQRERGLSADEADRLLRGADVERGARSAARDAGARSSPSASSARPRSSSRPAGRPAASRRIFTTGGGARIPRLNKVLSDRLRIPVQLANPIEKLQVADGVFDTHAGGRSGALADAPDRPRASQRGVTPTNGPDYPMITVNLRPDLKRKRARLAPPGRAGRRARPGQQSEGPAAARRRRELGRRARLAGLRRGRHHPRAERAGAAARADPRRAQALQGVPGREAAPGDHPRLAGRPDRRHPHRGRRPLRVAAPARRSDQGAAGLHLAGGHGLRRAGRRAGARRRPAPTPRRTPPRPSRS